MKTQSCTQCGAKLSPDDRSCTTCGAKVQRPVSRSRSKRRGGTSRRKQRRWPFGLGVWALGGGVLLLLAGLLFVLNPGRPGPAASTLPDSHDEQGIPNPEVPRIPLAEAKTRHDAGTALFVDVRTQGEYDTAHIANAISLPLTDLQARYRELPRDAEIITYCT